MTSASGDERAVIVEALARLLLDDFELEEGRRDGERDDSRVAARGELESISRAVESWGALSEVR